MSFLLGALHFFLWVSGRSRDIPKVDRAFPATARMIALIQKGEPIAKQAIPIVEKAAPVGASLVSIGKEAWPHVQALIELGKQAQPIVNEATPIVQDLVAEWQNVAPAVNMFVSVFAAHKAAGNSYSVVADKIAHALKGLHP